MGSDTVSAIRVLCLRILKFYPVIFVITQVTIAHSSVFDYADFVTILSNHTDM